MVNWVNDPDFGWYDADAPLGNVPAGATVIPGTDVLRNIGGDYHPDVVMPDPQITLANMGVLASLPGSMVQNATQGTGSEAQKFMARVIAEQADPGSITGTGTVTGTGDETGRWYRRWYSRWYWRFRGRCRRWNGCGMAQVIRCPRHPGIGCLTPGSRLSRDGDTK